MRNSDCRLKPKLLLSARDPATAWAICPLIEEILADQRFDLHVLAQTPAIEILCNTIDVSKFQFLKFPQLTTANSMRRHAKKIVESVDPDIVLSGISGPDFGVDEAILAVAPKGSRAPYALQCYWGDLNRNFPDFANTIFVLDEFAVEVTRERITADFEIVGSPKYEYYGNINACNLRREYRLFMNKGTSKKIIGFFGQPLGDVRGYQETISAFAQSLVGLDEDCMLVYRPHPKEPQWLRNWTFEALSESGKELQIDDRLDVESGLCGCDIIVSAFSTCGYDAQQLNRVSAEPLGVSVYLMFNHQLTDWFREYSHLECIPMTGKNMAVEISDQRFLSDFLSEALNMTTRQLCWKMIREHFPDVANVSRNIIEVLYRDWRVEQLSTA